MCTGGRLAKTGVTSATVSMLYAGMAQTAEVPWTKGRELCRLWGCEVQLSASVRLQEMMFGCAVEFLLIHRWLY